MHVGVLPIGRRTAHLLPRAQGVERSEGSLRQVLQKKKTPPLGRETCPQQLYHVLVIRLIITESDPWQKESELGSVCRRIDRVNEVPKRKRCEGRLLFSSKCLAWGLAALHSTPPVSNKKAASHPRPLEPPDNAAPPRMSFFFSFFCRFNGARSARSVGGRYTSTQKAHMPSRTSTTAGLPAGLLSGRQPTKRNAD